MIKENINPLLKKAFGDIEILDKLDFEVDEEKGVFIKAKDGCVLINNSNDCIVLSEIFVILAATFDGIDISDVLLNKAKEEIEIGDEYDEAD